MNALLERAEIAIMAAKRVEAHMQQYREAPYEAFTPEKRKRAEEIFGKHFNLDDERSLEQLKADAESIILQLKTFPEYVTMTMGIPPTAFLQARVEEGLKLGATVAVAEADYLRYIYMLVAWAWNGLPVFKLGKHLSSALVLTDPAATPLEMLKLPFQSFALDISESPLIFDDPSTGKTAEARFLFFCRYKVLAKEVSEPLDSYADQVPPDVWWTAFRTLLVAGKPEIHQDKFVVCAETSSGLEVHHVYDWPAGPTIGSLVTIDRGELFTDRDSVSIEVGARMAINTALWLAERPAKHRVSWSKRAKKHARHDSFELPSMWELGREVVLGEELLEAASAAMSGQSKRAEWRLKSRFVVRGHWRNQACGPMRLDHKPRWISPYWKGSVNSPGISHLYEATEDTP